MEFLLAPDIQTKVKQLVKKLSLDYLDVNSIVCFRSHGSSSRARARIWAFPRIWQIALRLKPHYCIEILAEKFDHLSANDQLKVLIHELLHIPKNFSGSLIPHGTKRSHFVNNRSVERLWHDYCHSR
ncbi:MAG: putative metallopeptidase [Candidatus Beckwithbacteria bacterium]|nr:putative metallopeptidase [Candidatus Beckwithbacteria bacterium]